MRDADAEEAGEAQRLHARIQWLQCATDDLGADVDAKKAACTEERAGGFFCETAGRQAAKKRRWAARS